ncbi:MAG: hypothetical protein QM734_09100 [Cyclobacteriaceae bacterium]
MTGYNFNKYNSVEIGVVRGLRCFFVEGHKCDMIAEDLIYSYFSLSSEIGSINSRTLIVPKIGYHYVFGFISIGANAFCYNGSNYFEIGARPEVGVSLSGIVNLNFGYNMSSDNHQPFDKQNINLSIIFGTRIHKDYLK